MSLDCESGKREVVGSHLLIATGRRPNTDDLGLDRAGIKQDARGYIEVDDQLRTNVAGMWALGDCNGRGAFTHTSWNDFEIVSANLLDGDQRKVSDRITAYALYTDPPLGRAGMSEAEVRRSGPPRAGGEDRHGGCLARFRERRDRRIHEGAGRRRDQIRSWALRSWARAATRQSIACSTPCTPRRPTPSCSAPCIFIPRSPSSSRRCSRTSPRSAPRSAGPSPAPAPARRRSR